MAAFHFLNQRNNFVQDYKWQIRIELKDSPMVLLQLGIWRNFVSLIPLEMPAIMDLAKTYKLR